jgi:hypothetical protein
MSSKKKAAIEYANRKFAQLSSKSVFWPNLDLKQVHSGLIARIESPSLIWQSTSHLCGMATFFNVLAADDPYFYAYYVQSMYRICSAYLGYAKDSPIAKASKLVRGSALPPGMAHVDWLALASLRDHLNQTMQYGYKIGVPFLKDIPLLGLPFSDHFLEAKVGFTAPEDLAAMLGSVGYQNVENLASRYYKAPATTLSKINGYLSKKYKVLVLLSPGIVSQDFGGSQSPPGSGAMLHWVRIIENIDFKKTHFKSDGEDGLRFEIYNPASAGTWQPCRSTVLTCAARSSWTTSTDSWLGGSDPRVG